MKKLTLFLLLPLALLVGAIYLLIPTNITVTKIIAVNCTATASARFFMDTNQWHTWWPIDSANKSSITSQHFYYKNAEHQPIHPLFNGHQIATTINEQSITGEIIYAQVGVDSVAFFWKYLFTTSTNPIQRVKDYLILRALKNNISEISRN